MAENLVGPVTYVDGEFAAVFGRDGKAIAMIRYRVVHLRHLQQKVVPDVTHEKYKSPTAETVGFENG